MWEGQADFFHDQNLWGLYTTAIPGLPPTEQWSLCLIPVIRNLQEAQQGLVRGPDPFACGREPCTGWSTWLAGRELPPTADVVTYWAAVAQDRSLNAPALFYFGKVVGGVSSPATLCC